MGIIIQTSTVKLDFIREKHHVHSRSADRTMLVVVSTDPENRFSADDIKKTFPFASVLLRCTTRPEFAQMLAQCFGKAV